MAEAPAAKPAASAATAPVAAAPAAATPAPAGQHIEIIANDMMKFSVTRIEAVAGSALTVTLTNKGTLPKTAMGHNFVLLAKGANANGFATAAMMARDTDYIPAAQAAQVLGHTKILGPGESDTVNLTVPSEPGEYVFLCSFPGHYGAGMKGLLVVSAP